MGLEGLGRVSQVGRAGEASEEELMATGGSAKIRSTPELLEHRGALEEALRGLLLAGELEGCAEPVFGELCMWSLQWAHRRS